MYTRYTYMHTMALWELTYLGTSYKIIRILYPQVRDLQQSHFGDNWEENVVFMFSYVFIFHSSCMFTPTIINV